MKERFSVEPAVCRQDYVAFAHKAPVGFGRFQKSGALISTPNKRVLIVGAPTKGTPKLWKQAWGKLQAGFEKVSGREMFANVASGCHSCGEFGS